MAESGAAFLALRSIFVKLKTVAVGWLKPVDKYFLLVLVAILIYAATMSWFMLEKHYNFATFAWDLGIFNQAFHSTLFNGKLLYFTCELYLNPSGSYFASKFSPILFFVLPFYALWPRPEMLLIFKSFVLGLAALPLYLVSSEVVGNKKAGFAVAVVYLLYPAVQAANAFDFQPQLFIPITFFSMCYFMFKQRWKPYFLFVFMSLIIEEHVAIVLFLFSLVQLVTRSRLSLFVEAVKSLRLPRLNVTTSVSLVTMILSVGGYFVSRSVRESYPLVPQFVEVYRTTDGFHVLGSSNDIVSAPVYALLNPERALVALSYDAYLKVLFVVFLFAPLLFLSFRSKLSIAVVALLVPFLLSNYLPYYSLGAQYPLYSVPLLFLAAVEGLRKTSMNVQEKSRGRWRRWSLRQVVGCLLIVTVVFSVFLSPVSPLSEALTSSPQILWYQRPYSRANYVRILHGMIDMIPPNASVLTQNNIFPHLSDRINAYVLPVIRVESQPDKEAMEAYVRALMNLSDFILLDSLGSSSGMLPNFVLDEVARTGDFGTYVIGQWAILFVKRGDGSRFFVPDGDHEVFGGGFDFTVPYAQVVSDAGSSLGRVAYSARGASYGTVVYGPYVFLPPGVFNVTFEVKFGRHNDGYLGKVDVSENFGSVLAAQDFYGVSAPVDVWTNYTLTVSSTTLKRDVEFRMFTSGLADLYLDRVIVQRVS